MSTQRKNVSEYKFIGKEKVQKNGNTSKVSFSLNLGIVQLSGDLSEEDRQCAWELYAELSTRVAVTGKVLDSECKTFEGEL
jgi:hypothetical protein